MSVGSKAYYRIENPSILEKIEGRKAIFLDMNIWIDLAEDKSEIGKRIKLILLDLVKSGVIFCPISNSLIWELYKQNHLSRCKVGELMENLSLNLCFAIREEVFQIEMEDYVMKTINKKRNISKRHYMFVPISAYLSSRYSLTFPESWPKSNIELFENLFSEKIASLKLTDLLKMIGEKSVNRFKNLDVSSYTRSTESIWQTTKGNKEKVWRMEEEGITRYYILPFINALSIEYKTLFFSKLQTQQKDKYGGYAKFILESLPAMKNLVEVMAIASLDPKRKYKQQDFFDLEMLSVPLAYATAFLTRDRWVKELLLNRSSILKRNRCEYFSNLQDFEEWLKRF